MRAARRCGAWILLCLGMLLALPVAQAAGSDEVEAWLERAATASRTLDYRGTFVYQSGPSVETSAVVRQVRDGREHERLEVLDGSPREVIRNGDDVRYLLPEQKLVIVDRGTRQRSFPARLPAWQDLARHYLAALGESGRVAGRETRLVTLTPRDALRYGYQLWIDEQTALPLKVRMVAADNTLVEQFVFSEVHIGDPIDAATLTPRYVAADDWRVIDANGRTLADAEVPWQLAAPLPGYELTSVVRRVQGADDASVVHMVWSDGLATISVFIEPLDPHASHAGLGLLGNGAVNIYTRKLGTALVTVLGEVPAAAVQRLGDALMEKP